MKRTIKRLFDVKSGEVFKANNTQLAASSYFIRVWNGGKNNALNLVNFYLTSLPFETEVIVVNYFTFENHIEPSDSSRFERLFGSAVEGLIEFYDELGQADVLSHVKERVHDVDTGNNQQDYENIRNQVEGLVQCWILNTN
jgi:hypothetical protein